MSRGRPCPGRYGSRVLDALLVASLVSMALLLGSCVGAPEPRAGTALSAGPELSAPLRERAAIEAAIAMGGPASLEKAMSLARASSVLPPLDVASFSWVAYEMARLAYPELSEYLPPNSITAPDTPLVRAFIDARNGKITVPGADATPLQELLPALVIFRLKTPAASGAALSAIERFNRFGIPSALADLTRGLALERSGDSGAALAAFTRAEELAKDCYPATVGRARTLVALSRGVEALAALEGLEEPIASGAVVRRVRAQALYQAGRWDEAWPLVTAVLLADPLDARFALIRAHLLVERGEYRQAAPLLDAYANIDPYDRLYILLRARSSLESAKDRKAAAAALRVGMERYPGDTELMAYAAEVLWGGGEADKAEAVAIARRVAEATPGDHRALRVLLSATLAAGDYGEAASVADAILATGASFPDSDALHRAYKGAGRVGDAAAVAKSWLAREPSSEAAALAWADSLVARGDRAAASELIARLLAAKGSPAYRSSLYWLQSRIQPNEDAALSSLRSALVENGMNLEALIAMSDIYVRRADYQKARFYLKQAISIAPARQDIAARRAELIQLGVAIP